MTSTSLAPPGHGRNPRRALATALLLASLPGVASAGTASGLPWASGSDVASLSCLAALRKRPMDAGHLFLLKLDFAAEAESAGRAEFKAAARRTGLAVVSVPLLTDDTKGQFARCASGAFDGSFRKIGANLKAAGARRMVASLGWEANIGSRVHPWGYDTVDQLPAYKACFRRASGVLKAAVPGLRVEWDNAKIGAKIGSFWDSYPGDSAVDIIGVLYYDQGFPGGGHVGSDARWDQIYGLRSRGGPLGIGSWYEAAQSRHKLFAVPEWGLRDDAPAPLPADDPTFVRRMGVFFRAHAAGIAYETIFGIDSSAVEHHRLCATTVYPQGRDAYVKAWR
jgi:hypothetical protein